MTYPFLISFLVLGFLAAQLIRSQAAIYAFGSVVLVVILLTLPDIFNPQGDGIGVLWAMAVLSSLVIFPALGILVGLITRSVILYGKSHGWRSGTNMSLLAAGLIVTLSIPFLLTHYFGI